MTDISVQLYSLREASKDDFPAVLSAVADMGYDGVEPFNLFGMTPAEFCARLADLGLRLTASHYPWANRHDPSEVIDILGQLGLSRAIGGYMPDDFADRAAVQRTIDTTLALADKLSNAGISLCLHNHYWEYELMDGRPAYHWFQEQVPNVEFELDTYWASNFGACDPAEELRRIRHRTPLIHIKDGPLAQGEAMLALGEGAMDIPAILNAADANTLEAVVVELDICDTDMFEAIANSHNYISKISER